MSVGLFRWSTTNRRIDNAVKRLHGQISDAARQAYMAHVSFVAEHEAQLHEAFNTAARSIGQSRRQRNQRGLT